GNRERRARALESEPRNRRHIAEGILPLHRGARHQRRAIGERQQSGGTKAEEGISDVLMRARARQHCGAATFLERAIAHMHVSKPRERLDRHMTKRHAVPALSEHLPDIAVKACPGLVGKAGKEDAAAHIDAVERVRRAAAHIERTELAAGIGANLYAVDAGAARPRVGIKIRAHIARHKAGAQRLAEPRIDTGKKAAEPAFHRGGIAIAVGVAPAAETLRPESQIAWTARLCASAPCPGPPA